MSRVVSVAPERLDRWLSGFAQRHGEVSYEFAADVVRLVGEDEALAEVEVPFEGLRELTVEGLVEHVNRARWVGVLLVRRGGYGVGVFDGTALVESKVGSRYVQGTTKAGGWSQQRYARRRDNQAREAFAAATEVAVRILAGTRLDAVVCGGDRKAIDTVLDDPRLSTVKELVRPPFLGVADPKLKVLDQAGQDARAVRIRLTP